MELAEQAGIEPSAEGIARASGLSVRIMRAVLGGHTISNRTWQALVRTFGPDDGLFVEAGGPPKARTEEAAREEQLARFRARLADLPPETADQIMARAALNASVELRIARDEARASGAGARHAAELLRSRKPNGHRVR